MIIEIIIEIITVLTASDDTVQGPVRVADTLLW